MNVRSHAHHAQPVEEAPTADAATEATTRATATTPRFTDFPTFSAQELPTLARKYDAVEAWNARVYGRVLSERKNDGLAFAYTPKGETEEKVFATTYINNNTAAEKRPTLNQMIAGKVENGPVELSVQLRGKILGGLGGLFDFAGVKPGMTQEDRTAAISKLSEQNPRIGNLVSKYGAILDVGEGTDMNFLNNVSIKAKHIPDVIRDLAAANNSKNNQHVGALRVAQVLEATLRQFERDGLLPKITTSDDAIAVDRYRQETAAPAAAGHMKPTAGHQIDEEPPF